MRVGVSGWSYPEWRGVVYPKGLVQRRELEWLSSRVNSIEINGTFYSLQSPKSFQKWRDEAPNDLVWAVKGSKFITHQKKLRDVRIPLANFFASGLLVLGERLGPILWQFPAWFKFDRTQIDRFLHSLPRTAREAASLASQNTIKKPEKAWSELVADVELRYAFEPRHASFFVPECIELFRKHNAAFAIADTAEEFGYAEDITADFVYIRLHGKDELYASDYTDGELDRWAKRIKIWAKGEEPQDAVKIATDINPVKKSRDVCVYFDNSMKGHAAFDAFYLATKLGIKIKSPVE